MASQFYRNEVTFIGRLGKDPEMKYTQNGKAVTKSSLAVWQGENKDALWLNIVSWEEVAETFAAEAHKGDLVQVKGRLTSRKYEGKTYFDVVADEVELVVVTIAEKEKVAAGTSDDKPF